MTHIHGISPTHLSMLFRAEKTMTAADVTGFDAIFSTGFFATFSRFEGTRLTKLHINTGEKAKIQWRASSGDGAPKLQISVPCRSVELVLSYVPVLLCKYFSVCVAVRHKQPVRLEFRSSHACVE